MVFDGKAVGLLLDPADEGKDCRRRGNADLPAVCGDQRPGAVVAVLDHAVDGDVQLSGPELLQRHFGLACAAVDEQKVRQGQKALVPRQRPVQPAAQDLIHGAVVVAAGGGLDLILFIGALQRPAAAEHGHGSHRIRPGGVGDVIGLHPHRRSRQPQHLLQKLQGLPCAFLRRFRFLELQLRVVHGQLDLPALFAPLGQQQGAAALPQVGEIILHGLLVFDLMGKADGPWRPVQLGIILLQKALQRVGRVALVQTVQKDRSPVYQNAALIGEPDDAGPAAPQGKGHRVGIRTACHHRDPQLPQPLDGADPVAKSGGLFKGQLLRRQFHALLELGLQFLALPLQHLDTLADQLLIILRREPSRADAAAFFHVQLQTGALLADVPGEAAAAAGQQKGLGKETDGLIGRPPSAVGAEIPGAVPLPLAGDGGPWIVLPADADEGIALVVLQQDIVFGLVFFDQRVFQQQSVQLGGGKNRLKMVDVGDHPPGLHRVRRQIGKILAHPAAQAFGLAHIDHCPRPVVHQIDAGQLGQTMCLILQLFKGHSVLQ